MQTADIKYALPNNVGVGTDEYTQASRASN